jgi:hypothetical protein
MLPYTYIFHICIVQSMFCSDSNVANRQMRPETRVGPHVKCPLHRPSLTKIRKYGRNLVGLTNAKFHENPLNVVELFLDRQTDMANLLCALFATCYCEPAKGEVLIFFLCVQFSFRGFISVY